MRAGIRDFMPEQHRSFFAALPYLLVAASDASGWPLATLLQGDPGFITSPDAGTLRIAALPGAIDPAVTQGNLGRTICRSGYSESVRPSESITEREKIASLRSYGDRKPVHDYEYDHLVSLELGGAPNDARNLWPEPGASPNPKDSLENLLHRRVCDHEMTLAVAQRAIAQNWVAADHRYR